MRSFGEVLKVIQSWRQKGYGVLEVLCILDRYLPQKFLSVKPRYVVTLSPSYSPVHAESDGRVRLATNDDVPELARLENKPREFHRRFARNQMCVAAEAEGSVVGYDWYHLGPLHYEPDLDHWFRAGERTVWLYDAYVDDSYRKKGTWRRMTDAIIAFMSDYHEFKAVIDYTNDASLKAHLRYGFRVTEQFVFISMVGFKVGFHKVPSVGSLYRLYRRLSLPTSLLFNRRAGIVRTSSKIT